MHVWQAQTAKACGVAQIAHKYSKYLVAMSVGQQVKCVYGQIVLFYGVVYAGGAKHYQFLVGGQPELLARKCRFGHKFLNGQGVVNQFHPLVAKQIATAGASGEPRAYSHKYYSGLGICFFLRANVLALMSCGPAQEFSRGSRRKRSYTCRSGRHGGIYL